MNGWWVGTWHVLCPDREFHIPCLFAVALCGQMRSWEPQINDRGADLNWRPVWLGLWPFSFLCPDCTVKWPLPLSSLTFCPILLHAYWPLYCFSTYGSWLSQVFFFFFLECSSCRYWQVSFLYFLEALLKIQLCLQNKSTHPSEAFLAFLPALFAFITPPSTQH